VTLRSLVNFFLPGTILFLIAGLTFGTLLLYVRRDSFKRMGRIVLTLITLFYLFASTRVGADVLLAPLYRHMAYLSDAASARGATAVVLLNPGANTYSARGLQLTGTGQEGALRIIEAARVYRLLGDPLVIIAGGFEEMTDRPPLGVIMAKSLKELGVPEHRIVIEPASRNTRQHVENLRPFLEKHRIQRFVLVTSPVHMWRSSAAFSNGGYDFVPSAAALRNDLSSPLSSSVWPDDENLDRLVWGTHEYMGLLYYWWHGWI
jgi:uncharacterized SAM-binding protein YcdF (DUF218 family)